MDGVLDGPRDRRDHGDDVPVALPKALPLLKDALARWSTTRVGLGAGTTAPTMHLRGLLIWVIRPWTDRNYNCVKTVLQRRSEFL